MDKILRQKHDFGPNPTSKIDQSLRWDKILGRKMNPYLRTVHVDHEGDVEAESMVREIDPFTTEKHRIKWLPLSLIFLGPSSSFYT